MNNKLDYIAIDLETANQYRNSACSVGLVRFIDRKETDSCYSLIHPAKMYFIPEWTRDIQVEDLLKACGSQIRTF